MQLNFRTMTLFIAVAILLYYFYTQYNQNTNNKSIDYTDYSVQPYIFKESERSWNLAHGPIKNILSKYAYISFDLRHKVNPRNVYIPGYLDISLKCNSIEKNAKKLDNISKRNIKELQDVIKRSQGRKIRVSGGHHTFNDISISNDIIIRTFNLKNVLKIDKKTNQITVEAGILLQDLNLCLEINGLALHVLPAIPFQSLGGVLATASHGSRYNKGSFSSMIVDIIMILADGSVKTFTKKDEEFPALTTSLGCLGVIYSVTLQCEKLFVIEHKKKIIPWKKVHKNLDKYRKEFEFFQAYIKPFGKDLKTSVYFRKKLDINKVSKKELLKDRYVSIKKVDYKIDVGHRILTKNQEASFYTEMEIAIPYEVFGDAIKDAIKLINKHKNEYGYDTKHSLLVRFCGEDENSLLSMTSGRKLSVFINTFNKKEMAGNPKLINFFKAFENLLVNKYNGRPHYGKQHFMTLEKMIKVYGKKNIKKFQKIRDNLDPQRMFSNDYVNRLLGV